MVCVSQDTSVNFPSRFWIIIFSSLFLLLNVLIVKKAKSLPRWPQVSISSTAGWGETVLHMCWGWRLGGSAVLYQAHFGFLHQPVLETYIRGNECELSWSSAGGTGYPLQYFHLENSMDRGAWQATVHGVTWWNSLGDYWVTKWPYLSKIPTKCQRMPSTSSPWSFSCWICLYRHSAWMLSICNTPMFTTSIMLYTKLMQVFTRQHYKG